MPLVSHISILRPLRAASLFGVAALVLSACAMNNTAATRAPDFSSQTPAQSETTVGQLAARYKANPRDKATIIYYATALRIAGQPAQAVSVMESGVIALPNDVDIKVNYAKALSAAGRYDQALSVITDAIRPDAPDWNALLVKGAILDQMGNNAEARNTYSQALLVAKARIAASKAFGPRSLGGVLTRSRARQAASVRRATSPASAPSGKASVGAALPLR